MVRCARHRCPEACCMFEQPENIRTALARFQGKSLTQILNNQLEYKVCLNYFKEREYYIKNILNVQHACDILFLFLHRGDENERVGKMLQDWF